MRKNFTKNWEALSSNQKSVVISVGAFALATLLLKVAVLVFPEYSFTETEAVVVGAFSGFLVSFAKNFIKLK